MRHRGEKSRENSQQRKTPLSVGCNFLSFNATGRSSIAFEKAVQLDLDFDLRGSRFTVNTKTRQN